MLQARLPFHGLAFWYPSCAAALRCLITVSVRFGYSEDQDFPDFFLAQTSGWFIAAALFFFPIFFLKLPALHLCIKRWRLKDQSRQSQMSPPCVVCVLIWMLNYIHLERKTGAVRTIGMIWMGKGKRSPVISFLVISFLLLSPTPPSCCLCSTLY